MWSDFESDIVEGRYPLGKLVRSEGRCGWFETRFESRPAIISLIESLNDENVLLDRLHAAERVKDANVAAIYEAGESKVRDTPLVYAVMEYTEENLEDVLRARALSAEETKQVAESLLNALRAIHKERLVCGRLEASSVLAIGDAIKLRSDSLHLAPRDVAFESYAAKDVRDLGSLLHQCLTQRPLKAADGNDPALQLLAPPFVQIVRRTLSGDATVDEIAETLRTGKAPAPVPAKPALLPAEVIAKPSAPVSGPVSAPSPVSNPVPDMDELVPQKSTSGRPLLLAGIFVGIGLLVLFGLRAVLHHSEEEKAVKDPVVVVSPEPAAPRKEPAPVAPPTTKPKASAPAAVPVNSPAAPVNPSATPVNSSSGNWRVVAFTYNHQDQAEHKASTINARHPDLGAGVFSPKGSGSPYLVTLGPATDRASAFRLREKAVAEGLPRDTYAQNFSR